MYKELILSYLIEPKFKKKDLDIFDYNSLKLYAQEVINNSIREYSNGIKNDLLINKALFEYENNIFNLTSEINILIDNEIDYVSFLPHITDNSPLNLRWLKSLADRRIQNNINKFKYPINLVLIVEGITEETLLPIFAQKCGFNLDENGIQIISAGGKNQVVKSFYTFAEQLKIPVFVLLDNDAKENFEQIKLKMRKNDKIYLLKGGEFEDILPLELIQKTLNDYFKNLNYVSDEDFKSNRMVENLEEIFKIKGFHEFKKAEFAQLIKAHIESHNDISPEINEIIKELKSTLFSSHQ